MRRDSFPIFVVRYKGIPKAKEGMGILTVSSLRDVSEMNVSPTAVFHVVMNPSSDIGSLYKYRPQTKLESNSEKKKQSEPTLYY